MMNCKIYSSITDKFGKVETISKVLTKISDDTQLKILMELIRSITDIEKYKEAKKNLLPTFTPNAIYGKSKKLQDFEKSSGFMYIDIDGIETIDDVNMMKSVWGCDKYIHSLWTSVSGKGLGGLVKIDNVSNNEEFKIRYKTFTTYINDNYNIDLDEHCCNLNRINFISHDDDMFINKDSEVFNYTEYTDDEVIIIQPILTDKYKDKFPNTELTNNMEENQYSILKKIDGFRTTIYIEDFKSINTDNLKYDGNAYVYEKGIEVPNLYVGKEKSWRDGNRNKFLFIHIFSFLTINRHLTLSQVIDYSVYLMSYTFEKPWSLEKLHHKIENIYNNFHEGVYGENTKLIKKYTFFSKDNTFNRIEKTQITKEYIRTVRKDTAKAIIEEKIFYTHENTDKFIDKRAVSEDVSIDKKMSLSTVNTYWCASHNNTVNLMNIERYNISDDSDIRFTKKLKELVDYALILKRSNKTFNKKQLTKLSKCSSQTVKKYWKDILIIINLI